MSVFHLTKTDNNKDYSIRQGSSFFLRIKYNGLDISTWTPRGQIRKKYADFETEILANFSFTENSYDAINDWTLIVATLSPAETEALPAPTKRRSAISDNAIAGKNVWLYDIEVESLAGEVIRILEGYVEINQEVTR